MDMLSVLAIIVTVFVVVAVTYGYNVGNRWKYSHIPGPSPTLFVGNLVESSKKGLHIFLLENARKYGSVFRIYLGRNPFVVVSDPEMVREIGVKNFVVFHDRGQNFRPRFDGFEWNSLDSVGMLIASGKYWAGLRAACEPLFHRASLQSFAPLIHESAGTLVARLAEAAAGDEAVNMNQYLGGMTLEVIGSAGFGVHFNAQQKAEKENPLVKAAQWVFNPPNPRSLMRVLLFSVPHLSPLWVGLGMLAGNDLLFKARQHVGYLYGTSKTLLDAAKSARLSSDAGMAAQGKEGHVGNTDGTASAAKRAEPSDALPPPRLFDPQRVSRQAAIWREAKAHAASDYAGKQPRDYSLLYKLMGSQHREEGRPLSDHEITAQAYIFILAGYETTSTALAFALYEAARNPGVQERIVAEIDAYGTGQPGLDDLDKFPYTEAMFLEAMRMYPPVTPLLALKRKARDAAVLGGYRIPAGANVFLNVMALHHDPANFPDPEVFKPERFLKGAPEADKHHPYSYIPFGVGPRKCIGYRLAMEEAVMALVRLFQRFTFELDAEKHPAPHTLKLQSAVTLSPIGGIWLKPKPREAQP